jgi:hypothetical protein
VFVSVNLTSLQISHLRCQAWRLKRCPPLSCALVLGACRPEYCRFQDNQCCAYAQQPTVRDRTGVESPQCRMPGEPGEGVALRTNELGFLHVTFRMSIFIYLLYCSLYILFSIFNI